MPTLGLTHPPPAAYNNASIASDPELLGDAPWFNRDPLQDEDLVRRYAVDGWLPGNISIEAVLPPVGGTSLPLIGVVFASHEVVLLLAFVPILPSLPYLAIIVF